MGKRGTVYNKLYTPELWEQVNESNKALLEDFLIEKKSQKKKKSTIEQYRYDGQYVLIYILKELGNKSILELNKKHFRNMSLWFIEHNGVSNARNNRLLSMIRSMMTFAEEDDDYDIEVNYASKVKGLPKEEVREICFLTDEQINILREELRKRKEYQKMLLLDLAYDSSGRRNELNQVLKEGLLEKSNTNVVIGKRGKKFPLIYFSHTKESLKLWLDQRGDDDIDSLWVQIRKDGTKKEAGYELLYDWFVWMADLLKELIDEDIPFTPHSFRHSSLENFGNGSHYALKEIGKERMDINELKVLAHHSDISTTSSYLKNNESDLILQAFGIEIK
jgi:integrase